MSSSGPGSDSSAHSRTNSWDSKLSRVVLYDPLNHGLKTDRLTEDDHKSSLAVQLPRWRNRVNIYIDQEAKFGFVATVKLDRLGRKANWQRRLRYNYTILYMKGFKPEEDARPSTSLTSTRM